LLSCSLPGVSSFQSPRTPCVCTSTCPGPGSASGMTLALLAFQTLNVFAESPARFRHCRMRVDAECPVRRQAVIDSHPAPASELGQYSALQGPQIRLPLNPGPRVGCGREITLALTRPASHLPVQVQRAIQRGQSYYSDRRQICSPTQTAGNSVLAWRSSRSFTQPVSICFITAPKFPAVASRKVP